MLVVACHDQGTQPLPNSETPTKLVFIVQPSNTTAGETINPSIQVVARGAADTDLTAFAGQVTLAIGINLAGGILSGTTTVTASSGVATFPDLSIDAAGVGYTLIASAGEVGAKSNAFNNLAVCRTNNCWTVKAAMPTVRSGFGVGTINGLVYTVGGNVLQTVGTVEAYDPNTNSWTSKAPMSPRSSPGVGVVNGVLYAVGGTAYGGAIVDPTPVGTVEAYDPGTNAWTTKQPLANPRYGMGVAVVNGIIYAIGGLGLGGGLDATVDAYDPVSNTWTTKAPMPTPRFGFAVGVVNGILYTVGGDGAGTVEAYDPATNTWTTRQPMLTPRSFIGVGAVNGLLYAVGGATGSGTGSGFAIANSVEAYDPTTDTWTSEAQMPTARRGLGIGVLNGVIYAFGGQPVFPGDYAGTNEAYLP